MKRRLAVLTLILALALSYGGYTLVRQRHAQALFQAAEQAAQHYDFLQAHTLLEQVLQVQPGNARGHFLAARAIRRGQFDESFTGPQAGLQASAEQHLEQCRQLKGPVEDIALESVLLRVQQGERGNAEKILIQRVQAKDADAPLILEALIYACVSRQQRDRAVYFAEALLSLEPDNVPGLDWRGQVRQALFFREAALQDLERAVELNPDLNMARFHLADILLAAGNYTEAAVHLEILHGRIPENLWVRLAWARLLIARAQTREGCALLDAWLADAPPAHPRRLEALDERASAALAMAEFAQVEAFARSALQISPCDERALYSLYSSLNSQGRHEEAGQIQARMTQAKKELQFLSRAIAQLAASPNDLALRRQIGEAYLRLEIPGEAMAWFNGILDSDPRHRPTLQTLADYFARRGDTDQAAEYRRRLESAGP
ncbi:MAG TPA: tetratricopeptide repeat protein [Gemmataceae bacterium]|jgi:tetratricopeptide (TPR) repeat protein|nr:tetratricopeptide repeat protein [Gemmataceae bacterium]